MVSRISRTLQPHFACNCVNHLGDRRYHPVFFLFLDESGKPESSHPELEFVVGGILIRDRDIPGFCRELSELRAGAGLDEDIEFHASDIIGRKGSFKHLHLPQRLELFVSLMKKIAQSNAHPISVLVDKEGLIKDRDTIETIAFRRLLTLGFAAIESLPQEGPSHAPEICMVLMDSVNPQFDSMIRQKLRGLLDSPAQICIIESPVFVDSRYHDLIQMADCLAYATRRSLRRDTPPTISFYQQCLAILEKGRYPLTISSDKERS